jgi:hypothetical protein
MNTRAILAIVRKDLKVALQNKGVVLPIDPVCDHPLGDGLCFLDG